MFAFLVIILAAYLLGSVPFGVMIASAHGKDLRSIGSGNIGATNVARALGRKWAYLCFLLDVLKGLLPMLIAKSLVHETNLATLSLWLAAGCAAVIGHVFPIYLRFKGGKGVATSVGVILGLYPYYTIPGLIAFLVWLIFVLIWRYVSLASIAASLAFPIALIATISFNNDWHFTQLWPIIIVALAMPLLVILRHVENIKRLLEGSEAKILQKVK
jgi:glycerol-3-phosphate acyltransferase PlsY